MKLDVRIKDGLDPKGVVVPGKNGIWPSNYEREVWRLPSEVEDL